MQCKGNKFLEKKRGLAPSKKSGYIQPYKLTLICRNMESGNWLYYLKVDTGNYLPSMNPIAWGSCTL